MKSSILIHPEELTKKWKNVSVHLCSTLIVDFAKKNDVHVLLRGVHKKGAV